jgi:hypothetical protein
VKRAFESLTEMVRLLRVAAGGTVYAAFGRFQARGTNTVPLMLTPSGYVANARSALANLSLLRRANVARGPCTVPVAPGNQGLAELGLHDRQGAVWPDEREEPQHGQGPKLLAPRRSSRAGASAVEERLAAAG